MTTDGSPRADLERGERRSMERALEKSTARYERLLDTIPCALYDYVRWPDGRSRFVYISARCAEIFEHDAAAIMDDEQLLWRMVHPDDLEGLRRADRKASQERRSFQAEVRILPPSGRVKWIELTSRPGPDRVDGQVVWSGVILDVSERKRAEEEKDDLVTRLQTALAEVRTLSRLLPICSHCKKIRDDSGYWDGIESYIAKHSETRFSHGICPECAAEHYPELLADEDVGRR